jgi:hypothetical protein
VMIALRFAKLTAYSIPAARRRKVSVLSISYPQWAYPAQTLYSTIADATVRPSTSTHTRIGPIPIWASVRRPPEGSDGVGVEAASGWRAGWLVSLRRSSR